MTTVETGKASREQRRAPRRIVLDRAVAFQNLPLRRFSCVVRDISDTGARLIGADIDAIRGSFVLTIQGKTTEPRVCEVVWRRHRVIGVRFVPVAAKAERRVFPLIADASLADGPTIIAAAQAIVSHLAEGHEVRKRNPVQRHALPGFGALAARRGHDGAADDPGQDDGGRDRD